MRTKGTLKDYLVDQINFYFQISKGIPQGSALSGFIFILCLTPLLHMINASKKIKPIEIEFQYMNYPNEKLTFPKISAFADDVNILATITKQGELVPEIDELKDIFNEFKQLSSLSVNLDKTFSFSSIKNEVLDFIETNYMIKNETKSQIRMLGHVFKPIDHLNSKPILSKIEQSIIAATTGLKKVPTQGRYILTSMFLSSQINYHIYQVNNIYKRETDNTQQIINRFIKAPFTARAKYKAINKGGAEVPNVLNIIGAGKVVSFKSYMPSKYCYKTNLRSLLNNMGFQLMDQLNAGIKINNMFLNLLDKIGLTRLKIIAKETFRIINLTRPNHIPVLGNEADPNLPKNPKSVRSLKYKKDEFAGRNPIYSPLTQIRDLRHIVKNKFGLYTRYKIKIPTNDMNKIGEELAIIPHRDLSKLCGVNINKTNYNKICKKIKQLVNNLKRKNKDFALTILDEIENNSLILALENGSKKTQKLAIKAQQVTYEAGTTKTAQKFNKEGVLLQQAELAKATEAAFKMKVGPVIRNFAFKYATRSLITEHRLAIIQNRDENTCKYSDEKITIGHYYLCPLTCWMQKQLEQALLVTFGIVDNTPATLIIGRQVNKNYNERTKGKAHLIQALHSICRYLVHIIHNSNALILNHDTLMNSFYSLIRRYITDEIREDANKVIEAMEVYHNYNIEIDVSRNNNMETCTMDQKELWAIKTWRAAEWEATQGTEQQHLTRRELRKIRAKLYTMQDTEEDRQHIILDMEQDIKETTDNDPGDRVWKALGAGLEILYQ